MDKKTESVDFDGLVKAIKKNKKKDIELRERVGALEKRVDRLVLAIARSRSVKGL